jgi:hypothetical protein
VEEEENLFQMHSNVADLGGNSEKDEGCDYYKVGIVAVVAVVASAVAGILAWRAHLVRIFLSDHHLVVEVGVTGWWVLGVSRRIIPVV